MKIIPYRRDLEIAKPKKCNNIFENLTQISDIITSKKLFNEV